jgi:hypothetical protein
VIATLGDPATHSSEIVMHIFSDGKRLKKNWFASTAVMRAALASLSVQQFTCWEGHISASDKNSFACPYSCCIRPPIRDANEKRYLRCYNISSAFMNTNTVKDILMVLRGELAEMMVHIAPQIYQKHITVKKGGNCQK